MYRALLHKGNCCAFGQDPAAGYPSKVNIFRSHVQGALLHMGTCCPWTKFISLGAIYRGPSPCGKQLPLDKILKQFPLTKLIFLGAIYGYRVQGPFSLWETAAPGQDPAAGSSNKMKIIRSHVQGPFSTWETAAPGQDPAAGPLTKLIFLGAITEALLLVGNCCPWTGFLSRVP